MLTFPVLYDLRAQINAYRSLARNQPVSQQIAMIAAGKRTGEAPPECPTPPAQPLYGEGQGAPASVSGGVGATGGKPGVSGTGGEARGGGGAPPTPLPMTGQMAPPTQLTPPLVNPVNISVIS